MRNLFLVSMMGVIASVITQLMGATFISCLLLVIAGPFFGACIVQLIGDYIESEI